MKGPSVSFLYCFFAIVVGLSSLIIMSAEWGLFQDQWTAEVNRSLYLHLSWRGHPWYIAPMEGKMVEWHNGSSITVSMVNSDYWDSCEHNPCQSHLIGVDFVNKTLYDIRVRLDQDVRTRNYTATDQTIVWANASLVVRVR